jgi:divalent metal cation (Fe/Co/Zn/Cd) transporter
MTITQAEHDRLQRRGIRLEWATTGWNLMEVFVTIGLGVAARSLALVAFGLSSMIEVFASSVVIWHLREGRDPAPHRTRRAFRLIAVAFFALALFLFVTSVRSLLLGLHPGESPLGIAYLALTAGVMFTLAAVKRRTARTLGSGPLEAEATMTYLDGWLCIGILTALGINILFGWWWADALAALGIGVFAVREGLESFREAQSEDDLTVTGRTHPEQVHDV